MALLGSRIGRSIFLALFAFQRVVEHAFATGRAGDPLADGPGGIVADVLIVSAGELGDPVPFFILVIANDWLFHRGPSLRLGAVVLLARGVISNFLNRSGIDHHRADNAATFEEANRGDDPGE